MSLTPEIIHALKIIRLLFLFAIIVLGSRFFYYQRKMRALTKKQIIDMTPAPGVMEAYDRGDKKPYEEYQEKAKPISELFGKNLNKANDKMEQSNNWLVWSTMALALSDLLISILPSGE